MQQRFIAGNRFQTHMNTKFNLDLNSALTSMQKVKGKEDLVYEYIIAIASIFRAPSYNENPSDFYANYSVYKKDFVSYWRRALDIAKADSQQIEEIFDDALITQEQSKGLATVKILFENGQALTAENCLYAIYDVLELQ